MRTIESLKEMTETARGWLASGTVGFVPIKSTLHEGHMALIQEVQKACEIAVVGLSGRCATREERTQFERNLQADLRLLSRYQNLVVFIPRFEEMYPAGFTTHVTAAGLLVEQLDDDEKEVVRSLMTLKVKLFHLVRPDVVYCGQKDALHIAILNQVIHDLNIDVRLRMMPTARESDGLALSSRNSNLSAEGRKAAALIYSALLAGRALIMLGERRSAAIEQEMVNLLQGNPLITLEFAGVYAADTFLPVAEAAPNTLLSIAARIGAVRLLDTITWVESERWRM